MSDDRSTSRTRSSARQVERDHGLEALAQRLDAADDARPAAERHDGHAPPGAGLEDRAHLLRGARRDHGVGCVETVAGAQPHEVRVAAARGVRHPCRVVLAEPAGPTAAASAGARPSGRAGSGSSTSSSATVRLGSPGRRRAPRPGSASAESRQRRRRARPRPSPTSAVSRPSRECRTAPRGRRGRRRAGASWRAELEAAEACPAAQLEPGGRCGCGCRPSSGSSSSTVTDSARMRSKGDSSSSWRQTSRRGWSASSSV